MRTFRALAGFGGLLALASVSTGCSSPVVEITADFPAFASVQDLQSSADAVVEVEIGGRYFDMLEAVYDGDDPEVNPLAGTDQKPPDAEEGGVAITVYEATVITSYAGDHAVGDVLEIQQLGGEVDGKKVVAADVTPLVTGKTVLVFLEEYPDAPAAILGGDAGLFAKAAGGTYQSMSAGGVRLTATADELKNG